MSVDLSTVAGFPLALDLRTLDIVTGDGIRFRRAIRGKSQMTDVLLEPEAIPDDAELYYNFGLTDAGSSTGIFQRYNLTFACVLLPSMKVGREYGKTHGHYHPHMPGLAIAYPEVYTHYYGELYLLMHRRSGEDSARLDDCVLYEMQPGKSITIPPGYLHVLINPSDQPALMAGLYCMDSYPEYGPVTQMHGAAYYLVEGDIRGLRIETNSHYTVCPPLRRLEDLAGSQFAPPRGDTPLWTSFVNEPEAYAMLSDPAAARNWFRHGE